MRRAKQYSIVDHQILHRGFFHDLGLESLVLYFFLVTVGDKNGRSFYSAEKIVQILRLDNFNLALGELCQAKLVFYKKPYYWVTNFDYFEELSQPEAKRGSQERMNSSLKSAHDILHSILKGP